MSVENASTRAPQAPEPAYTDIQGLLVNGYRGYNYIRFLIFTIPAGAEEHVRKLCGALIPGTPGSAVTVTAATRLLTGDVKPVYRLNLGITQSGLKKLLGDNYATVLTASSQLMSDFDLGAANPSIAGIVGDTGLNDPSGWWQSPPGAWRLPGQSPQTTSLDLVFSLYATLSEERDTWTANLLDMIGQDSAVLAFQQDSDPLDPAGQQIHFGYRDGISQPRIAGFSETNPLLDDRPDVAAWHFIIKATSPDPPAPTYTAHPLLNNGSFAAFRMLYQDVKSFEDFIHQNGPEEAELIASRMCGRWRDGTPVEISPTRPQNHALLGRTLKGEYDLNNFDYVNPSAHQEPKPAPAGNPDQGQACPYASHIRRTNPRDDDSVTGNNDFASSRRILRRARPYGPPYDPASGESQAEQRGLIGFFICADLQQQFEFLMQTWVNQTPDSTLDNSPTDNTPGLTAWDPLFGPQQQGAAGAFAYCTGDPTVPADYTTLPQPLPQLVITKGGLYVFIPSIGSLTHLANGTLPS